VAVEVKFCGMTREEDVREAVQLGASYVGVIFAGGPRHLSVHRAARVLQDAPRSIGRIGVFAKQPAHDIGEMAKQLGLTGVQLHAGADPQRVRDVRAQFKGEVWGVVQVKGASIPAGLAALFAIADAVVLDAHVDGKLGGTGERIGWAAIAEPLREARAGGRLVLAGGLRPENVVEAVETLHPDVVDVSSGIESSPGIKDHARMRAFIDAAHGAQVPR
jgi:phosphoribosylanthranilate isomerase